MTRDDDPAPTSTRPYLIRAIHEWCTDNGYAPHLAVRVDRSVQVPVEYVRNGEIVLNVGFEATSGLRMGNDFIEFKARFGGVAREILVPVTHVIAIYARENGQGMAFPPPESSSVEATAEDASASEPDRAPLKSVPVETAVQPGDGVEPPDGGGRGPSRPQLKRVK